MPTRDARFQDTMRLLLSSALLVTACASAQVMRVDSTQRPPTNPDSVRVFLEEPDRPYDSIALVEVSDQGWGLSLETLRTKLAQEAAKLGGQAVIIGRHTSEAGAVIVPIGNTWYAGSTSKLVGKVIVFRKT